jgi:hypothetical protein
MGTVTGVGSASVASGGASVSIIHNIIIHGLRGVFIGTVHWFFFPLPFHPLLSTPFRWVLLARMQHHLVRPNLQLQAQSLELPVQQL